MTREEFKSLFDEHFEPLRNFIYYKCGDAELATDIAQDTFMKLWEKQPDKRPKELIGLLYKMAKDAFVSKYRRSKIEQEYVMKPPDNTNEQSPEEELAYKELKGTYEKALKKMPDKQREVFLLSRMDELKYHEIADRLELSVKAVEKRMKNALQFLRTALTVQ
ncbi:RNA polymerase sigma factor [Carboxylicivirga sp. N1Y90]|uniref:RNA polymerase sigma factor n=1 Tax=Carboxylicivirga fragile TaxID=3417571 RepID=UPI003D345B51|nr:RNA polymerase sigma-70 factor [Marinilabiliaceae bacterium N1Y90]